MKLSEVTADVAAQPDQQAGLGVKFEEHPEIPTVGPVHGGLWFKTPNAVAVFADLKRSTALNVQNPPEVAPVAYSYFVRGMAAVLGRFSARYVDIQGDAVFGLFSGAGAALAATACAIAMRTVMKQDIAGRFQKDAKVKWNLEAGIGIDQGTLYVRQLGLKEVGRNEVWSGNPVNVAAKLSAVASPNQVVVSDRVFAQCSSAADLPAPLPGWLRDHTSTDKTSRMWARNPAPKRLGLEFKAIYRMRARWCESHGEEFCNAIIKNR